MERSVTDLPVHPYYEYEPDHENQRDYNGVC